MTVSMFKTTTAGILALTMAAGLGAPAFAAGYSQPEETPMVAAPAPVMAAPVQYATGSDWTGAYAGLSLGSADVSGSSVIGDDVSGMTYGVHGGYNVDFGSYVIGGELDYSMGDITDDSIGLDVDSVTRAKLRVGYDAGAFLPYAVVGGAMLNTSGAIDDSDNGYLYGVGVDYAFANNMVLGAEVLQHEFNDYAGSGIDVSATTIAARVSFKF